MTTFSGVTEYISTEYHIHFTQSHRIDIMAALPKIKLLYLDGRGRAEMCRWIMAIGSIPYEDIRIKMEDWPKRKPETLFGQVPVLHYGDVQLAQSAAIYRFLARKADLMAGGDDVNVAKVEMVCEHVTDFWTSVIFKLFVEKDEAKLKALSKETIEDKLPKYMTPLEKMLADEDASFLVGGKISLADLSITELLSLLSDPTEPMRRRYFADFEDNIFKDYPKLEALVKRVRARQETQKRR